MKKDDLNEVNFLVLKTIAKGDRALLRELVKPVGERGYGLSLDVKNYKGYGPVLIAVAYGQAELLRELVTPIAEGGYGLSFDVKSNSGAGPVLVAAANNKAKLLHELVTPKAEGGYGLSLNVKSNNGDDPGMVAVRNGNTKLLCELLKPVNEGGFGLRILGNHIFNFLWQIAKSKTPDPSFIMLFARFFNQSLKENELDDALDLAGHSVIFADDIQLDFIKNDLVPWLRTRYQELLITYMSQTDLKNAQKVVEALEVIAPGDSHYYLGKCYEEHRDFSHAFTCYFAAFNTSECENKLHAGMAIANIIFTGNVILYADGKLNEKKTGSQKQVFDDKTHAQRKSNRLALNIMQARVIFAYEYLYKNNSESALQLKARFNEILCGNLEVSNNKADLIWQPQVAKKYRQYYQKKNSDLLNETSLINAELQLQKKSSNRKRKRSAFFSEPPSKKLELEATKPESVTNFDKRTK